MTYDETLHGFLRGFDPFPTDGLLPHADASADKPRRTALMRRLSAVAAALLALACALAPAGAASRAALRAGTQASLAAGGGSAEGEGGDGALSPEENEAVGWELAADEMRQTQETEAAAAAARARQGAARRSLPYSKASQHASQCLAPRLSADGSGSGSGSGSDAGAGSGSEGEGEASSAGEEPHATGPYAAFADLQQFVCVLNGAAHLSKGAADARGLRDVDFEVPPECRPSHHVVFSATSSLHRHHHLVLFPDGKVAWRDTAERYARAQRESAAEDKSAAKETVSLSGLVVPLVKEVPLDLTPGWATYRTGGADVFGAFGFFIHRGLCHLTGSVAHSGDAPSDAHAAVIAKLPATCTPPSDIHLVAAAGDTGIVRLRASTDGTLAFVDLPSKLGRSRWISLAGIAFPQSTPPRRAHTAPLVLAEPWQFAASSPEGPAYWTNGNLCLVHGVVARCVAARPCQSLPLCWRIADAALSLAQAGGPVPQAAADHRPAQALPPRLPRVRDGPGQQGGGGPAQRRGPPNLRHPDGTRGAAVHLQCDDPRRPRVLAAAASLRGPAVGRCLCHALMTNRTRELHCVASRG